MSLFITHMSTILLILFWVFSKHNSTRRRALVSDVVYWHVRHGDVERHLHCTADSAVLENSQYHMCRTRVYVPGRQKKNVFKINLLLYPHLFIITLALTHLLVFRVFDMSVELVHPWLIQPEWPGSRTKAANSSSAWSEQRLAIPGWPLNPYSPCLSQTSPPPHTHLHSHAHTVSEKTHLPNGPHSPEKPDSDTVC